jgi:2,4-dienoyl-CoA reductase-like NADH-dependent reductase (Old Yellow Enzyme family)
MNTKKYAMLFAPVQLGSLHLKHRVVNGTIDPFSL